MANYDSLIGKVVLIYANAALEFGKFIEREASPSGAGSTGSPIDSELVSDCIHQEIETYLVKILDFLDLVCFEFVYTYYEKSWLV